MEDIIKSIKATLYERTSNPFLFSFVIAWCIHNFRVFMIIFSDESLNTKLVRIDSYFDASFLISGFVINYGCILHAIAAPLFYALTYIYVFPFFSIKINRYHFIKQKELLSVKQDAEELELLTVEKSRELRRAVVLLEGELGVQIEKLEQENNELKNIIKKKDNDVKTSTDKKIIDEPIQLLEEQIKILMAFSGSERRTAQAVADSANIHVDKVKLICSELEQKKFLSSRGTDGYHRELYGLEHLGRKYLADHKLI